MMLSYIASNFNTVKDELVGDVEVAMTCFNGGPSLV
jgi:hypothetical protein